MPDQKTLRHLFSYNKAGYFIRIVKKGPRRIGTEVRGSRHRSGYVVHKVNGRTCQFHRSVFIWHFGAIKHQIDHKNGIKTDNRVENLRLATPAQNGWNKKMFNPISGFKNVYWDKNDNLWYGAIQANGKRIKTGFSKDINITIKAVRKLRKKLHGEFHRG